MADDLSFLYAKLSLNQEECIEIPTDTLNMSDFDGSNLLVGRVMANRIINFDSISSIFKRLWNPRHGLSCKPLGENIVLFMFNNTVDMKKVINGSPWLFDKSLLALTEAQAAQIGSKFEVSTCQFWVQIHDIPIGLMNKSFVEISGNTIGKYLGMDVDSDGYSFGRFLRIRVDLDITKPLKRVLKTTFKNTEFVLPIKYERLPNFCYFCGIIGHSEKKCDSRILNPPESPYTPSYGAWIRAASAGNPFLSPRIPPQQSVPHENTNPPNPTPSNPSHANPISHADSSHANPSHANQSHANSSHANPNQPSPRTDPKTTSNPHSTTLVMAPPPHNLVPSFNPPPSSTISATSTHTTDPPSTHTTNQINHHHSHANLTMATTIPLLTNFPHNNPPSTPLMNPSSPPSSPPLPSHYIPPTSPSSPFLVPVRMELDTPARKIAQNCLHQENNPPVL
ncbi:hypothetical protein DH2020_026711 [Rehmannia glutinosa]|uniref:CCHC-type domain-containing protein n=1 Tax=Rehmannia glutinosa TaxID=99300 RepID=A0ABR0VWA5_REHGL